MVFGIFMNLLVFIKFVIVLLFFKMGIVFFFLILIGRNCFFFFDGKYFVGEFFFDFFDFRIFFNQFFQEWCYEECEVCQIVCWVVWKFEDWFVVDFFNDSWFFGLYCYFVDVNFVKFFNY